MGEDLDEEQKRGRRMERRRGDGRRRRVEWRGDEEMINKKRKERRG